MDDIHDMDSMHIMEMITKCFLNELQGQFDVAISLFRCGCMCSGA